MFSNDCQRWKAFLTFSFGISCMMFVATIWQMFLGDVFWTLVLTTCFGGTFGAGCLATSNYVKAYLSQAREELQEEFNEEITQKIPEEILRIALESA